MFDVWFILEGGIKVILWVCCSFIINYGKMTKIVFGWITRPKILSFEGGFSLVWKLLIDWWMKVTDWLINWVMDPDYWLLIDWCQGRFINLRLKVLGIGRYWLIDGDLGRLSIDVWLCRCYGEVVISVAVVFVLLYYMCLTDVIRCVALVYICMLGIWLWTNGMLLVAINGMLLVAMV